MMIKVLLVIMTVMSLLTVPLSPAAFTPAVGLAVLLMALSGTIAMFGYLKTAVVNLALTTVAVMISPFELGIFYSLTPFLIWGLLVSIGYGGLFIGIMLLQDDLRSIEHSLEK